MCEVPNGFLHGMAMNHLAVRYSGSQMPLQYITKSDTHLIQAVARSCLTCILCGCVYVCYNYFVGGKTKKTNLELIFLRSGAYMHASPGFEGVQGA